MATQDFSPELLARIARVETVTNTLRRICSSSDGLARGEDVADGGPDAMTAQQIEDLMERESARRFGCPAAHLIDRYRMRLLDAGNAADLICLGRLLPAGHPLRP